MGLIKNPVSALAQACSAKATAPITVNNTAFSNPKSNDPGAPRNTRVQLTSKDSTYTHSTVAHYDRVDLSVYEDYTLTKFQANVGATSHELIRAINRTLFIQLGVGDIQETIVSEDEDGPYLDVIATPTSLVWTGSIRLRLEYYPYISTFFSNKILPVF